MCQACAGLKKEMVTMAEYIKKEDIEQKIQDGLNNLVLGHDAIEVLGMIYEMPTADVAPVRHGRWIESPRLYYGAKQYECSLCYSDTFWNKHRITEKYPCCPNCGAIMDLEG